jgi:hypothetical protein
LGGFAPATTLRDVCFFGYAGGLVGGLIGSPFFLARSYRLLLSDRLERKRCQSNDCYPDRGDSHFLSLLDRPVHWKFRGLRHVATQAQLSKETITIIVGFSTV